MQKVTIGSLIDSTDLFYSGDAGSSWRVVHTEDDGGMGWADLGFTTAADGVVEPCLLSP